MEVLQVTSEFAQMVELYRERKPKRVLEIGCWDGGTLRAWLQNAAPEAVVVAVDLKHRNERAYEDWVTDTTLVVLTGSSQEPGIIEKIRSFGPYDWAFIDGDHDEELVQSDADITLPLIQPGGLMLFHDITPAAGYPTTGPSSVFAKLQQSYETWEIVGDPIISHYPFDSAHGIGVVQV